jgi:hypothetical protein
MLAGGLVVGVLGLMLLLNKLVFQKANQAL